VLGEGVPDVLGDGDGVGVEVVGVGVGVGVTDGDVLGEVAGCEAG
jgi:hypothetical protein